MKFLCLFLLTFSSLFGHSKKRVIDLSHDWPVDPNDQGIIQSQILKDASKALLEKNIHLVATDLKNEKNSAELAYVVLWGKRHGIEEKSLTRFPTKKKILFMWEPPVVKKNLYHKTFHQQFKRIYTWDDDLVDNKKYFKFYYPVLRPLEQDLPAFEHRKLLTQVSCNKVSKHARQLYTEREKVIQFFEDKPAGGFDFYGHNWHKKGYKNFKGTVENKIETLKQYRFSVCYENMCDVKGYVTEKIFDCFAAGTIPIYWGASNIADYVPKNCFIDRRDFKDFSEVYNYIRTMDKATYETYLQNIAAFLRSDKAQLFSQEMFNVIFLEAVRFP